MLDVIVRSSSVARTLNLRAMRQRNRQRHRRETRRSHAPLIFRREEVRHVLAAIYDTTSTVGLIEAPRARERDEKSAIKPPAGKNDGVWNITRIRRHMPACQTEDQTASWAGATLSLRTEQGDGQIHTLCLIESCVSRATTLELSRNLYAHFWVAVLPNNRWQLVTEA